MSDTAQSLVGSWLHSHEEDSPDRIVYRPIDHPFPPARGRSGWTLKPDGEAECVGPGADDRRQVSPARWSVKGQRLRVETARGAEVYDIVQVDRDALVLKRRESG